VRGGTPGLNDRWGVDDVGTLEDPFYYIAQKELSSSRSKAAAEELPAERYLHR
jgi:hypothetical protein